MTFPILFQFQWLFRIIIAGICGVVIGYERDSRSKEAGIRTHLIVALGSALMMVVSKYGFADITHLQGIGLDPSRIAAQVVSGIGFLGAGMIFVRHQYVNGLTTAAGIWATAGIGMAVGAGLYFIGIGSSLLILIFQIILHRNSKWFHPTFNAQLGFSFSDDENPIDELKAILSQRGIEIMNMKIDKREPGQVKVKIHVQVPQGMNMFELSNELGKIKPLETIEY